MFDITNDHLVPIRACRPYFPSAFKDDSVSDRTIRRWIGHGRNGVKLRSAKIGGIRYTSIEAIREFVRASVNRDCPSDVENVPSKVLPTHRRQSASKRLDERGFRR